MTIKEQLQLLQKLSGLTQTELAARLGVTFVAFNRWMNGRAVPRLKMREKINKSTLFLLIFFESITLFTRLISANSPSGSRCLAEAVSVLSVTYQELCSCVQTRTVICLTLKYLE